MEAEGPLLETHWREREALTLDHKRLEQSAGGLNLRVPGSLRRCIDGDAP